MNRILGRVLQGAACAGALAVCLVSTPARAERVIVETPRGAVVERVPGAYAPPAVVVERPAGFWYGGRWQGPIVHRERFHERNWGRRGEWHRRERWAGWHR